MEGSIMFMFMGYSGSGKDTQAALLRKFLEDKNGSSSVLWISTGDMLREIVQRGSYAGKVIDKKVIQAGNVAPPFLATLLWSEMVIKEYKPERHLLFPSSPRTLNEAKSLDDLSAFFDIKNVFPIFLNVERKEVFRRLKARGRADDTEEIINNRLDYFGHWVMPAVEYFRNESSNRLIEIDGNPNDIQLIYQNILASTGLIK